MTTFVYQVTSTVPLALFSGSNQCPTILPVLPGRGMGSGIVKRDEPHQQSDGDATVTVELLERREL